MPTIDEHPPLNNESDSESSNGTQFTRFSSWLLSAFVYVEICALIVDVCNVHGLPFDI